MTDQNTNQDQNKSTPLVDQTTAADTIEGALIQPRRMGDTTSAEPIPGEVSGEIQKEVSKKGRTWSDVITYFFSGVTPIKTSRIMTSIPLLWIGLVIWLLIQDNQNNKLDNCEGIKWFLVKAGFTSIFFILAVIFSAILNRIEKRDRKIKSD